jgi:hypothetical protein
MGKYASAVVKQIQNWIGFNEYDGDHKKIIDIYNSQRMLPRGYKVKYTDEWCATTVSAVAVKLGYTDIIPTECSCGKMIEKAIIMGIWMENDAYVPSPGDIIMYDWGDVGSGNGKKDWTTHDCKGWADHVGIVERVSNGKITVIEGNYSREVKRRLLDINGRYIRGFICPRYDLEEIPKVDGELLQEVAKAVIRGEWGNGANRKARLEAAGFDYAEVQKIVNKLVKK